jgi:type IV pilus assembly protein PilC
LASPSKYYATEKGRDAVDAITLKLPVFGLLLRKVAVAKFTRTMGTMLASGVAILEALDIVARPPGTARSKAITSALGHCRGRTMADPLTESGFFHPWSAR